MEDKQIGEQETATDLTLAPTWAEGWSRNSPLPLPPFPCFIGKHKMRSSPPVLTVEGEGGRGETSF